MKKIRYFILENLFTNDEKYLIVRAIEDRIGNLEKISVSERLADKSEIEKDCYDYCKIKKIFSTKDYN